MMVSHQILLCVGRHPSYCKNDFNNKQNYDIFTIDLQNTIIVQLLVRVHWQCLLSSGVDKLLSEKKAILVTV